MATRRARRAGLALAGFALGLLLVLVGAYIYFRIATEARLAETMMRRLNLPVAAFELEELEGDSIAVVSLRDVVIRDPDGDTIAAAPRVRFRLFLPSLGEEKGPILITQALLSDPYVNLVQLPDGGFNLAQVLVTAEGQEVAAPEDQGRGFLVRDVRIADGRVRLVTPFVPDSLPIVAEKRAPIQLARMGGETMRIRTIDDLDARLPLVRVGTPDGWRVEFAALSARLTDPDLRVLAASGFLEEEPREWIRFAIDEFRTENSAIEGRGMMRFAGATPEYDVTLRASPVDFGDLRWLVPSLPAGGRAEGLFAFESRPGDRVAVTARDMVVTAFDSRIEGRLSAVLGGDEPFRFWNTRLALAPLRLETLEQLGLREEIPYNGEITGTIVSIGDSIRGAEGLRLDLVANAVPEGLDVSMSTVSVQGPITFGGPDAPVRFGGVAVALRPLHLAALRPVVTDPAQQERLRGVLRGSFIVAGTPGNLRIDEGDLAYDVGGAPPTRLTGLRLELRTEPELTFDLRARAQPLALGTLAELFPGLPFRTAQFSGPIRVAGTAEQFRLDVDLSGSAGRIALRGTVDPGTPMRFDLAGQVTAFNAEAVLTRSVPVEGPVSGSFAAAGTTENFRFNVDLSQEGGRFALEGRFRAVEGVAPQFELAGNVTNFNLGAAIGRPQLFPSRMTGRVNVTGGGGAPYRFDVDLRGAVGILDVQGFYNPSRIPTYSVSGTVAGLNLQELPGGAALPQSDLRGTINIQGQGTTLETLAGEFQMSFTGSSIGGLPLETLRADLAVRGGVLVVDTLVGSLAGNRLAASGSWGLTRPAANPLQFRMVARDLGRIAPLLSEVPGLEPRIAGSFVLQGTVAGSVREPLIDATFRGQNLRYQQWRAARLEIDADLNLAAGIRQARGELTIAGDDLVLPNLALTSLRLRLEGTADRMAVRLAASRPGGSDLAVNGIMELEGQVPRGVVLDSLMVRAGDIAWELGNQATVRWGGVDGVLVSNLYLQRVGTDRSWILVDGTLPPTGNADLRVQVRELDLELFRRLLPAAPEMAGVITLDATLRGPVGDPELFVEGRAGGVRYQGVALDSVVLSAQYDERRMETEARLWNAGEPVAAAEATIPMVLSIANTFPRFELVRTEPLRARITADSLPLALFTAPNAMLQNGEGVIAAQVSVSGTVERPSLDGWGSITGGAVTILPMDVRYERISGRFTLEQQRLRIDTLTVWSGGNAVVNGTVRFADLDRPELYLTADFNSFRAIDDDQRAELVISGSVALSGRMPEPVLDGRVVLQEGVIHIPNLDERIPLEITDIDLGQIGADSATARAAGPGFMQRVRISDLAVEVREGVWLEAENARVQIRGELRVRRPGDELRVFGTLQAVRGTYALTIGPLVREFDVTGGSVRFFGTPDLNPELDITAEHEVRAAAATTGSARLTIIVHLTGTAEYPRVRLTSNTRPPLPESELLSYLVFGQPSFRLTQTTGAFAQQVLVQELLGGLLVQELGQLGLPCEYFRLRGRPELLNSNPLTTTSLECGVEIADDVFLTVETGVIPGAQRLGVSLDWQVSDNLVARLAREPVTSGLRSLLLTPVEIPYQFSADVRGRWEFGRPREQPPLDEPTPGPLPGDPAQRRLPPPEPPLPAPKPEADPKPAAEPRPGDDQGASR